MASRLLKPTAFKVALLVGVVFSGIYFLSMGAGRPIGWIELLEDKALDVKFQLRGALPLSHKVALAAVDEKSIQRFGLWPWNRALLAQAITNLDQAGAASISLDIIYTDPDRNSAFATLKALRDKLPPPVDGGTDESTLALAEIRTNLDQQLAQSPDQAMAKTIDESGEHLVLGTLFPDLSELSTFTPEQKAAWSKELVVSSIPGTFKLDDRVGKHGTVQSVSSDGVPVTTYLAVVHPQVIQAWLPELAAGAKHFGYLSLKPDADGTLRHYEPIAQLPEGLQPAEGLAAVAAAFHAVPHPQRFGGTRLGDVLMDVDEKAPRQVEVDPFHGGQMLINYLAANRDWHSAEDRDAAGKPLCQGNTCDRLSLSDVIEGKFDPKTVEDKIIFIGVTAQGTFDQRVTPFDPNGPGVFVHVSVAEDIVSNRFLDHPGYVSMIEALMMLLVAVLFGVVVPRLGLAYKLAAFPVAAGLFLTGNFLAFKQGHQIITVLPVLELAALTFGVVFFEYMTTDREKRQVRSTFQHYLSNAVMEEMLEDPSKLKLGGQKKELTVFFSDIRGFTTLSEMLQPDEVSKMLNEYLTPMTDLVFEHKGTVDKYMGDAIMAFWGAPLDQPEHALQACKTSVAMLKQLDVLRAGWKAQGKPDIDIGIGLNSGMISVGNMGSNRMFNYTVIGDDVNLASRLEGTNKTYGTRIILGENTYKLVKGKVVGRELGGVMVKGKKKPVTIFELREIGEPSPEEGATIALFEKALAHYRAREWDPAEAAFKQVMEKWVGDGPSEKYLDDIEDKRLHAPPEGWDGTYVMKTK